MTCDIHRKHYKSFTHKGGATYKVWSSSKLSFGVIQFVRFSHFASGEFEQRLTHTWSFFKMFFFLFLTYILAQIRQAIPISRIFIISIILTQSYQWSTEDNPRPHIFKCHDRKDGLFSRIATEPHLNHFPSFKCFLTLSNYVG